MRNILWILVLVCGLSARGAPRPLRDPAFFTVLTRPAAAGASWTACTGCFLTEYWNAAGSDRTWVVSTAGFFNKDSTSPVFEGAQALHIAVTTATFEDNYSAFAVETNEIYFKVAMNVTTTTGDPRFWLQHDTTPGFEMRIRSGSTNRITIKNKSIESAESVTGLSTNTWYMFWGYFKGGSGANGISRLTWSTSNFNVRPAWLLEITNGDASSTFDMPNRVYCVFTATPPTPMTIDADAIELKSTDFQ